MNRRQIKKITEANLLLEQAVDLSKEGKFQLAIEILTKAVALNPKLVSAYSQRANAYRKLGSERLAIDDDARAASIELYGAALVDVPSSRQHTSLGRDWSCFVCTSDVRRVRLIRRWAAGQGKEVVVSE